MIDQLSLAGMRSPLNRRKQEVIPEPQAIYICKFTAKQSTQIFCWNCCGLH